MRAVVSRDDDQLRRPALGAGEGFPPFAGALLDHYKLTAGGESAGYVILFAMCGSTYVVAFFLNHVFAPRFEAVPLPER